MLIVSAERSLQEQNVRVELEWLEREATDFQLGKRKTQNYVRNK